MTTSESRLPPSSRAILIGVSAYDDPEFPPVQAARNSLTGMRTVLARPDLCGWPPEAITVIEDPGTATDLAVRITQLAEQADGVLLIYYAGHGTLTRQGELCLTVRTTQAVLPKITGLPWSIVAEAVRNSPARVRVAILDCCFSGQAIEALAGESGTGLADTVHIEGVYTLTATTRNRTAHVPPPDQQDTAATSFTQEFLNVVTKGIPDGPPMLTLSTIYPHLRSRLLALGLPRPDQRGTDTADRFPFTRNAAYEPGERPPVTSVSLLDSLLSGLASPHPDIRKGAVTVLGQWLKGDDPTQAQTARDRLRQVADTDAPDVATLARHLLETPAAETPTAETPTAETPTAETPTTETPTTETSAPATETVLAPAVETVATPAAETPAVEIGAASASETTPALTTEATATPVAKEADAPVAESATAAAATPATIKSRSTYTPKSGGAGLGRSAPPRYSSTRARPRRKTRAQLKSEASAVVLGWFLVLGVVLLIIATAAAPFDHRQKLTGLAISGTQLTRGSKAAACPGCGRLDGEDISYRLGGTKTAIDNSFRGVGRHAPRYLDVNLKIEDPSDQCKRSQRLAYSITADGRKVRTGTLTAKQTKQYIGYVRIGHPDSLRFTANLTGPVGCTVTFVIDSAVLHSLNKYLRWLARRDGPN